MAALSSVTGEHLTHPGGTAQETGEEPSAGHTNQEQRERSRAERAWR